MHAPDSAILPASPAAALLAGLDASTFATADGRHVSLFHLEEGFTAESALARFGFKEGHAVRRMVDYAREHGRRLWIGTAARLAERLTGGSASHGRALRELFKRRAVHRLLASLEDYAPDRVTRHATNHARLWIILERPADAPPPALPEAKHAADSPYGVAADPFLRDGAALLLDSMNVLLCGSLLETFARGMAAEKARGAEDAAAQTSAAALCSRVFGLPLTPGDIFSARARRDAAMDILIPQSSQDLLAEIVAASGCTREAVLEHALAAHAAAVRAMVRPATEQLYQSTWCTAFTKAAGSAPSAAA